MLSLDLLLRGTNTAPDTQKARRGGLVGQVFFLLFVKLVVDGEACRPGWHQPASPWRGSRISYRVQPCPRTPESQKPSLDTY